MTWNIFQKSRFRWEKLILLTLLPNALWYKLIFLTLIIFCINICSSKKAYHAHWHLAIIEQLTLRNEEKYQYFGYSRWCEIFPTMLWKNKLLAFNVNKIKMYLIMWNFIFRFFVDFITKKIWAFDEWLFLSQYMWVL